MSKDSSDDLKRQIETLLEISTKKLEEYTQKTAELNNSYIQGKFNNDNYDEVKSIINNIQHQIETLKDRKYTYKDASFDTLEPLDFKREELINKMSNIKKKYPIIRICITL
jgi:uncharacterized protein YydD (DUF2326 family)